MHATCGDRPCFVLTSVFLCVYSFVLPVASHYIVRLVRCDPAVSIVMRNWIRDGFLEFFVWWWRNLNVTRFISVGCIAERSVSAGCLGLRGGRESQNNLHASRSFFQCERGNVKLMHQSATEWWMGVRIIFSYYKEFKEKSEVLRKYMQNSSKK